MKLCSESEQAEGLHHSFLVCLTLVFIVLTMAAVHLYNSLGVIYYLLSNKRGLQTKRANTASVYACRTIFSVQKQVVSFVSYISARLELSSLVNQSIGKKIKQLTYN